MTSQISSSVRPYLIGTSFSWHDVPVLDFGLGLGTFQEF